MAFKPIEKSTSVDPDEPDLDYIGVDIGLLWAVMLSVAGVLALFLLLGVLTWSTIWLDLGLKFNVGYWFFLAVVLYIVASFWGNDLSTSEHGVLYFFGRPIWVCRGAGLKFVPWLIVSLDRLPADMQEIHAPGKKDEIFWGDDEAPVPPSMTRAIRMTTKSPDESENKPLDAQQAVGLAYFVLWTIEDPILFRAHIRTVGEADSQLRLVSTMSLSEKIGTVTPGEAISGQAAINEELDNRIRKETRDKRWGVQINKTGLTEINYSHALASALRDRAKASVEKETRITAAEGRARETELLGKADGKAARSRAAGEILGRVDGMKAMMEQLEVGGTSVLAAEATRGVLKDVDTMLLGGQDGIKDILGVVGASSKLFTAKPAAKKKGDTDETSAG